MLCARTKANTHYLESEYAICPGDSGSPVIAHHPLSLEDMVIGVLVGSRRELSYKKSMNSCHHLAYVLTINNYLKWIDQNLHSQSTDNRMSAFFQKISDVVDGLFDK